MRPDSSNTGTWARLLRDGVTVFAVERWPGPPDSDIYATGIGWFVLDHFDLAAAGGPEAIYHLSTE